MSSCTRIRSATSGEETLEPHREDPKNLRVTSYSGNGLVWVLAFLHEIWTTVDGCGHLGRTCV